MSDVSFLATSDLKHAADDANGTIASPIADLGWIGDEGIETDLVAELEEAQKRIAALELKLLQTKAESSALDAVIGGFMQRHPGLAGAEDVRIYGSSKNPGRTCYEKAFDAFLLVNGVANPEHYRADDDDSVGLIRTTVGSLAVSVGHKLSKGL